MKTKKEPIKAQSSWWCETCKSVEMDHSAMMEHLRTAHSLEPKGLKCRREMLMHVDSADHYTSQYRVTIESVQPPIVMTNSTIDPRRERWI